jgi:hypothetical protein
MGKHIHRQKCGNYKKKNGLGSPERFGVRLYDPFEDFFHQIKRSQPVGRKYSIQVFSPRIRDPDRTMY